MADHSAEPRATLIRLINGFQLSQAIHTFVQLRVPDLLADGSRTSDELAAKTGSQPLALYRLLRAVAAAGVVHESAGRVFALTALGRLLRSDDPASLAGWAALIGRPVFWQNWGQLGDSVRTGETAYRLRFGMDGWSYRAQHPEEGAAFDRAMVSITGDTGDSVAEAYDFGRFGCVVDVGGGRGGLSAALLVRYPALSVVLFDLPHVINGAGAELKRLGVFDRCQLVRGSFFDGVPPGGDAYVLKSVLHNWHDEEALRIVRSCRRAMRDEGVLLLVERTLDPPNQGLATKLSDLNMLVGAGGIERTEDEFRELLASASFNLTRTRTTSGPWNVIEALPVS